jgi:hypothetical protein
VSVSDRDRGERNARDLGRIHFSDVWSLDGIEYCLHVVEHLRSASRKVMFDTSIERHSASVGVGCLMWLA